MDPLSNKTTSVFDSLPSKSAFWLGFITAILTLGTLGFILLANCVLRHECSVGSLLANANTAGQAVNTAPTAAADANAAPAPAATAVPVVTTADHIRGAKDAAVTVVEYSDYQCPFCSRFHPTLQQAMKEYNGKIRWVFRHFPLSFHPNAQPAANAAECADEQGKFWEFTDNMYLNQDKESDEYYKTVVTSLGLNVSKWEDCYKAKKYDSKIQAQAAAGGAAGVNGTPGSFIIGKDGKAVPIQGALPYESVKAAIDQVLAAN